MKTKTLLLLTTLLFVSMLSFGYAADYQTVCTQEYAPVCGEDGKTYGNQCMAGDVELAHAGECIEKETETTLNNSQEEFAMCELYFDGCNTCTNAGSGVSACTLKACFEYEEPVCNKWKGVEAGKEKPEYLTLNLTEDICLENNGFSTGPSSCNFLRPEVKSVEDMQFLADYDNGFLRLQNLGENDCKLNGGNVTVDGNGIKACFIRLKPNNFVECQAMGGKVTKSIPAQCAFNEELMFKEELSTANLLRNQLSPEYVKLVDSFVETVMMKTSKMSDTVKNKYLSEVAKHVAIYTEKFTGEDKVLFMYIEALILENVKV